MSKFLSALKKYLDIYHGQENYFADDLRNLEFYKTNPSNTNWEDIFQKISVVDDPDFHKLNAQQDMADHILKINIDSRLAAGDLSVVEDIAHITLKGKQEHLLHFASVYCNLHRPDIFPIYSDQYADFYLRYIKENGLAIDPNKLNQYDVFSKALEDIIVRYKMKGKLNYLQMRKFAWAYADKVLEEAGAST